MLKIPKYPSINLSQSKNKVYIDYKLISNDDFLKFNYKNLKSLDVLKLMGETTIDGVSLGKYENGFALMFKTK
jgi:hypothetical protein